jgi:hypothetical protein
VSGKIAILRDFVRQIGKKSKPCNCYDPNVCTYSVDRENFWQPVIKTGQPFVEQFRGEFNGYRFHLMANHEVIFCEMKGGFDLGLCSINHPSRVYPTGVFQRAVGGDGRWPVFTSRMDSQEVRGLQLFLERSDVDEIIGQLMVQESGSLHFFEGSTRLYCKPNSPEELRSALQSLICLARLFAPAGEMWNLESLPESLRGLVKLVQKWAVPDDAERADLQQGAPMSELRSLVAAVDAHREEIEQYRNSVGESDEAAMALGTLEECAAEIRLTLSTERSSKNPIE